MDDNKRIVSAMNIWGRILVSDMKKAIDSKVTHGGGQSSSLSGSVRMEVENSAGEVSFKLYMDDYWYWFEHGRKPNNPPPPTKPIKEWLKKKGFSQTKADEILLNVNIKHRGIGKDLGGLKISKRNLKSLKGKEGWDKKLTRISWLFSKSIGKKGFKGKPFFHEVINEDRVNQLKELIKPIMEKQMILDIKESWQSL